jgi:ParB family chromosome partitioning protein
LGPAQSDRYEVVAGGRRLAALKLLAKQKRITKGTAIPCRVLDTDGVDGAEASLAENIVRQDMHPANQFEAFHGLHQGGIGIEDIAARFGVSAHTVRQRLRLASVSPALIQVYRDEDPTLDDLTAFAVTENQEAQERVFGQLQTWQRNPDTIRRLLTHALIPATDRKALFVGWTPTRQRVARCSETCSARIGAAGSSTPPCWSGLSQSGWSGRQR